MSGRAYTSSGGEAIGQGPMAAALRPLAARWGAALREHDILALQASLVADDRTGAPSIAAVRAPVLRWAARKAQTRPRTDWVDGADIEHFSGGRNLMAHTLRLDGIEFWAMRVEDPDKSVAGRVWTTEVVLGGSEGAPVQMAVRLSVTATDDLADVDPAVPSFIRELPGRLRCGPYSATNTAWTLENADDAETLCANLADVDRRLPVIVLSEYEPTRSTLLDGEMLAKSLQGLAHVALVPAELTYALSDVFGKRLSCFLGAARLYLPGFGRDADPYAHRLMLAETISESAKIEAAHRWLRTECARLSVTRMRTRRNEASFAAIRRESLAEKARGLAARGDLAAQLVAERERIEALERELSDAKELEQLAVEENHALEQRAEEAERQARSAVHRVQALLASRSAAGDAGVSDATLPTTWTDFLPWVEEQLVGQVVLAPKARRQVSGSPAYQDVTAAARCLLWLAEAYRAARLGGGDPDLPDAVVMEGVRNARCGADSFSPENSSGLAGMAQPVEWP